ncbi:nicotinate-nucleotide--dimethylbenzimidazole phosphoribosyltransferase [Hymenobacter weizhouensis]|uniref:nicotinate-nucleotide--dimethylbenzimidazole phosphoribosyltransferase n=1 Tax=Hymenobacter sp. YIM 151500-1 TaxID=2987689 RepID=UPI002226F305|nr:nicotinate-nucleotide--dimethylbenzimidazole phosphoribosyltransferase [Hymenobacter sp. YIM 151500-1]UYZ64271.1 nicotinate-nucleotide--dimethylbenzimidazole phosphoribosyltransferase [Hymenobacter sp. YIM 151500-1]
MPHFQIQPLRQHLAPAIQDKIDQKTKPLGALGQLEALARQLALIQQTLTPELRRPHLLVFAADHGLAAEGVSKYPAEVTYQMVLNFVRGGAAINVFCRQHGLELKVVDAGVKGSFAEFPAVIDQKIAAGTRNARHEPAMTPEQCEQALAAGARLVREVAAAGCNVVGFGEMGIGNTSAAALLMHRFTGLPLAECLGRGTGLDDEQLRHKAAVLAATAETHAHLTEPLAVLAALGGFEIVQMAGAMLQAAELGLVVLVDGFIATAALLAAAALHPAVREYCVFCHQSEETGHARLLAYLRARPLLHLGLRLGEGTGCALAYPLLESAVRFLNDMASFASAGVSQAETPAAL